MRAHKHLPRLLCLALTLLLLFAAAACQSQGVAPVGTSHSTQTAVGGTPEPTTHRTTGYEDCIPTTTPTEEVTEAPYQQLNITATAGTNYTLSNQLPAYFLRLSQFLQIEPMDFRESDIGVNWLENANNIMQCFLLSKDFTRDNPTPDEKKILSYEFEIPQDSHYDFCFEIKALPSGSVVFQIDDGEKQQIDYAISESELEQVRDSSNSTYLSGVRVHLTKGKHVIKFTLAPNSNQTFWFRHIFLVSNPEVYIGPGETHFDWNHTPSLPTAFARDDVLLLKGNEHLESDLGVLPGEAFGIPHYTLDLQEVKDSNGNVIPNIEKHLTWNVTIPADGIYHVLFELYLESGDLTGCVIQIDDGEKTSMDYHFDENALAAVRNESHGTYMSGYEAYLTAGEHRIQFTYAQECSTTFRFRNLYLVPSTETDNP
ncbi:MAG: hypothetical protein IJX28_01920 [Clostridia bacterium]|nr:hypothetical protein [Clostridia bacterium]